jgi:hypothetical protein
VLKISSRRIQGDDPELANSLRIEERELQSGGRVSLALARYADPLMAPGAFRGYGG